MATKKQKPQRPAKQRPAARPHRQQPESLRLRSMAASFTVSDLDKSVGWYRDVLGFVVGERWEEGGKVRGIQMKAGSCDIMLGQDDFAKGRDRKKGAGFRLWVATAQDIIAVAAPSGSTTKTILPTPCGSSGCRSSRTSSRRTV